MTTVRVRAASRLHVGLLDLGGVTRRRYGGCGFSLDAFHTGVCAHSAPSTVVTSTSEALSPRAEGDLLNALARLRERHSVGHVRVQINSMPWPHIGLGSKTSLILSVLTAAAISAGLSLSAKELALLSGRGGASGVGLHSFFLGGFIVDSGRAAESEEVGYVPSSAYKPDRIPALSVSKPIPGTWRFHLVMPGGARTYNQEQELALFSQFTPLPADEVLRAIAAVYHGVVPAVETDDLTLLSESIADLHEVGFKRRELEAQEPCRILYSRIREAQGLAVGLSSMGPVIYVVTREGDADADSKLLTLCSKVGASYLGCYLPSVSGHEVS